MKKQLLVIHGAESFDSYEGYLEYLRTATQSLEGMKRNGWKDGLPAVLPEYDVYRPAMPCQQNAKYSEWKIWFDKILPLLDDGVALVGHSTGGIFLAQYLSENKSPRAIRSTHLIAAPAAAAHGSSMADFHLPSSLKGLEEQGGMIYLYFSKDDPVIPFADSEVYAKLLPAAKLRIFTDKGHFNGSTFPELITDIQN